ncbi:MAG: HAMP domain-containing protein [Bacteroidales bacterium]|nr:HAMP domain-containing protein [Bacteroidales bacterium]
MRKSIAKRLTIYFLFLSLASTAIIGFYSYIKAREALIERTFEQLISLRTEKNNRLSTYFSERLNELTSITNLFGNGSLINNGTVDPHLLGYLKAFYNAGDKYNPYAIVFSDNNFYVADLREEAVSGSIDISSRDKEILLKYLKNQSQPAFIHELIPGIANEFSSIMVGVSFKQTENGDYDFLILTINQQAINNIMFEENPHNGLGESGETYLVGPDFLIRSNSRFSKDALYKTTVNTTGTVESFNNQTGEKKIVDYRNIAVFSAYSKLDVEGLDWAILAEIDVDEAMVPIENIRNNIIYLGLVVALFLIGVVAAFANMIASPIQKLKRETEKVAKGIYGETIQSDREDEIGDLIVAFNLMTLQLKEQNEKLEKERRLRLSSMIDGQEMERQRLSRELHDSLGQLILTIKMKLERAINSDADKAREILVETTALFSATVQEIRNISNNLMPSVLNEFGLTTGLKDLITELEKNTGLTITLNVSNIQKSYSEKIDIYLYRIVQEAINNILKHAQATHVEVCLEESEKSILLKIIDNGIGFNEKAKKGNGISNMRERANLMGGVLSIMKNASGEGTTVSVNVPI